MWNDLTSIQLLCWTAAAVLLQSLPEAGETSAQPHTEDAFCVAAGPGFGRDQA